MGNLYSENALHVESAKQLFITIFIPVVEHAPTLRHLMFLLDFSLLFIYHSFHIWPNWFSTFCSEWNSFHGNNFSTGMIFFLKKKKISGNKESLFVLNLLMYIFSICIYDTCTMYVYNNISSARAVGMSCSACAIVIRWVKILGWLRPCRDIRDTVNPPRGFDQSAMLTSYRVWD